MWKLPALTQGFLRGATRAVRSSGPNYCYLGSGTAIVRNARDQIIFVDTDDRGITPHLAMGREWEAGLQAYLRKIIPTGGRIIEVGANIGCHTLLLAELVGPQGFVYCFEPNPRVASLLRSTILVNGLVDRAVVHECAAMNVSGSMPLAVHREFSGSSYVVINIDNPEFKDRVDVSVVRIDDVLQGLPDVCLIRLDCEGAEPSALRGAEDLIRRSPQLLIVTEWAPEMMLQHGGADLHMSWLRSLGFKFQARINSDGRLCSWDPAGVRAGEIADVVFSRTPLFP